MIYSCLFQRFSFYKDSQKLFYDFEFNEENQCYYIVLEDGFVSALNFIIDNINYESYIPEFNISHIQDKGQVIMNNINNSGTFNAPVNNQIGNQNSSKQSQENQKQSGIKINFTAMLKALFMNQNLLEMLDYCYQRAQRSGEPLFTGQDFLVDRQWKGKLEKIKEMENKGNLPKGIAEFLSSGETFENSFERRERERE